MNGAGRKIRSHSPQQVVRPYQIFIMQAHSLVPFADRVDKTKTGRLSDKVSRLKTNDGCAQTGAMFLICDSGAIGKNCIGKSAHTAHAHHHSHHHKAALFHCNFLLSSVFTAMLSL